LRKKSLIIGLFLSALLSVGTFAQSQDDHSLEELLKKALKLKIQASLFHDAKKVLWKSELERLTIPGRPVTINMQNDQARLSVHFTPYRKTDGGLILVAQTEIWLQERSDENSSDNLRYFTSMKSIPLDYEELIYFYPLGKLENLKNPDQIHIEMILSISPYVIPNSPEGQTVPEGEHNGN